LALFTPRRSYRGRERRHHSVFVTRNSEYHCRDALCVAVRDLQSGEFRSQHPAIGRRMLGGVAFSADGVLTSFSRAGETPKPGESLFFGDETPTYPLRTSPLRAIQRPARAIVERYPS
jgi:hypothetical protein